MATGHDNRGSLIATMQTEMELGVDPSLPAGLRLVFRGIERNFGGSVGWGSVPAKVLEFLRWMSPGVLETEGVYTVLLGEQRTLQSLWAVDVEVTRRGAPPVGCWIYAFRVLRWREGYPRHGW